MPSSDPPPGTRSHADMRIRTETPPALYVTANAKAEARGATRFSRMANVFRPRRGNVPQGIQLLSSEPENNSCAGAPGRMGMGTPVHDARRPETAWARRRRSTADLKAARRAAARPDHTTAPRSLAQAKLTPIRFRRSFWASCRRRERLETGDAGRVMAELR